MKKNTHLWHEGQEGLVELARRGGKACRGAKKAAAGRLGGLATAAKYRPRNQTWMTQAAIYYKARRSAP